MYNTDVSYRNIGANLIISISATTIENRAYISLNNIYFK